MKRVVYRAVRGGVVAICCVCLLFIIHFLFLFWSNQYRITCYRYNFLVSKSGILTYMMHDVKSSQIREVNGLLIAETNGGIFIKALSLAGILLTEGNLNYLPFISSVANDQLRRSGDRQQAVRILIHSDNASAVLTARKIAENTNDNLSDYVSMMFEEVSKKGN